MNMNSFRCNPVILLLLIFVIVSVAGCYRISLSRARIGPETGWSMQKYGRGQLLVGPELDILIRSSNSSDENNNQFGISLWFDPKYSNLKFFPQEPVVLLPGTNGLKPKSIVVKWTGANRSGWECGRSQNRDFGEGPSYVLERGFCVELYFEIKSPSPDTPFSMRIDGVTRDGQRVVIPRIEFVKDTATVIDLPIFP